MPGEKIVVNLAPSHLRKTGSGFDLPIACLLYTSCCDASAVGARNETGHSRVIFTVVLD